MSNFDIRLRQYDDAGVRGKIIPTIKLTLNQVVSGMMTASATFSGLELNNLIAGFPIIAAVEYTGGDGWGEISNSRMIFQSDSTDAIDPAQTYTIDGVGYVPWLLQKNRIQTSMSAVNGQRIWRAATPGRIIKSLLDEAKARGWGPQVTFDFGAVNDSAGRPFTSTNLEMTYSLGASVWSVLQGLADQGVCQFRSLGTTLQVHNPGYGVDWTDAAGGRQVVLDHSSSTIPVKRSYANVVTDVTLQGEGSLLVPVHNDQAPTRFGRLEGWINQSGVTTEAGARAIAVGQLQDTQAVSREISVTRSAATMTDLPWVSYGCGDWVLVQSTAGFEKVRVIELVASRDQNGVVTISVVLGSKMRDVLSRIASGLGAVSGGVLPGGSKQPQIFAATPSAPTGVTATSSGYWGVDGSPRSNIAIGWTPVVRGLYGDVIDPPAYEVWLKTPGGVNALELTTYEPSALLTDLGPAGTYEVTVRAVININGNVSLWSPAVLVVTAAPTALLPAPSAPTMTSTLGQITVSWDGLLAGAAPPVQFAYVHVAISTTAAGPFVAVSGPLTQRGSITISGETIGATRYFRLSAVDTLTREGAASAVGSVIVASVDLSAVAGLTTKLSDINAELARPLDNSDLIRDSITLWPFKAGSIPAGALAAGTVSTTDLANFTVTALKFNDSRHHIF